jgi:ubiquinone/menaquinone biosynthesis C-methylase UbiE
MASYSRRASFVQALCPAPKRYLQQLISRYALETGLDIGCGRGSPLTSLRSGRFKSTGIDVDAGAIAAARANDSHDEYIQGDFRTHSFPGRFDVVVLSHLIEHFERDDGVEVMRRIERLAKRLIYVETPNGFLEQTDFDGNPFQRHLSGWFPHDFASRGYNCFGEGMRGLTGPQGRPAFFSASVTRAINRMTQWYYFRHPESASTIAAIKVIDERGSVRQL